MSRGTNTTSRLGLGGSGTTNRERRVNEMLAMERMPPRLCAVVGENTTNLAATSVLAYYRSILAQIGDPERAEAITARKVRELEAGEITVFAGEYLGRHGVPLPHVAAQATVLRYGAERRPKRSRLGMIRGFGLVE